MAEQNKPVDVKQMIDGPSSVDDVNLRIRRAAAVLDLQIAAADIKMDKERWKTRRKMAWLSLWAIFTFAGLMMFAVPVAKIDLLSDVFNAVVIACTTVVGAYVGSTTLAFISSLKSKVTTTQSATPVSGADKGDAARDLVKDLLDDGSANGSNKQ